MEQQTQISPEESQRLIEQADIDAAPKQRDFANPTAGDVAVAGLHARQNPDGAHTVGDEIRLSDATSVEASTVHFDEGQASEDSRPLEHANQ